MLRNYLTIALRALKRRKAYTFINVFGFAVGMASCLLIFMLVRHEWSYDRFHEHADRIYRTSIHFIEPDGEESYQNMMFPDFTPQLVKEFPAIEHATRYVQGNQDLRVGDEIFRQEMVEVDASFFEMFSFPLLAGDPSTALADPSGMVITEDVARAFFRLEDEFDRALGRRVSLTRNEVPYEFSITGVAANLPNNSSLQFEVAISFENYDNIYLGGNNWGGRTSTYVLLHENQDPATFETALEPFVDTQFSSYKEALTNNERLAENDETFKMHLQPLSRLHQEPEVWAPYEVNPHDPLYSYVLGGIGLLILLIACINFMTLSIGLSESRAREVGMRKVLGAQRIQVMRQFWGEALILTGAGLLLGLILALAGVPFFNQLIGQNLSLASFRWFEFLLATLVLLLVVGLVAGGYPSVLLSGFQPISVLKGVFATGGKNRLSKGLVVLQYTISIGLIVCTILMAQQLRFLLDKDLGYDKDLVMVVHANQISDAEAPLVLEQFRNTLLPYPQVSKIARAGSPFTRGIDRNSWMDADGNTRSAYNFGVDVDYLDLMGMEIVAGRNFSADFPSDSTQSILVNEALVHEFGIEDPIGTRLTGWLEGVYEEPPTIIGVVKDYNFRSLREEVFPAVMNMHPDYYNFMGGILIKVEPGSIGRAVELVENTWKETLPGKPFTYSFLDEDVAAQYQTEERWSNIVTASSILAIMIASLGLFGLATLTVAKRTKEIGIRKVLGASVPRVVGLIAGEFAKLVGIAAVIAWPLAYLGMNRWLGDFANHVSISVWPFVLAAVVALAIALITISSRAVGAALVNPVNALGRRS